MSNSVEILQSARKKKGLSQEALAAKIGISHRMLQRYEEGRFPKYKSDVVKRIDEVLGTNLYELIYESKGTAKETEDMPALLVQLMKAQNSLLSVQNKILEDQKESVVSKVNNIDENVTKLIDGLSVVELQVHSGRQVALESLARLEKKKKVQELLQEADKIVAEKLSRSRKRGNLPVGDR